jgi:hypothetical protein
MAHVEGSGTATVKLWDVKQPAAHRTNYWRAHSLHRDNTAATKLIGTHQHEND